MSFDESEYAAHLVRSRPRSAASRWISSTLAAPCSGTPLELARVVPVGDLRDGPQPAGEPQASGDDVGDLHRGRADQPHLVAEGLVRLRQLDGPGPQAAHHALVVGLLGHVLDLARLAALDEQQSVLGGLGHVVHVLPAGQHVLQLLPGEVHDLTGGEVVPIGHSLRERHDARSAHDRVVDVEERGRTRSGVLRLQGADPLGQPGAGGLGGVVRRLGPVRGGVLAVVRICPGSASVAGSASGLTSSERPASTASSASISSGVARSSGAFRDSATGRA